MRNASQSRPPAILRPSKFRLGYLVSIVVFALFSPFAYGTPECSLASIVGCTEDRLETPQGTIDGKNANFKLSQLPVNNEVVKLFLNQMELTQGTQYRVNQQILDFMLPTIPKLGDTLVVMYQVRTVDSSAAPGARDVVMSQGRAQSLVQSALSEEVLAERIPTPAQSGKANLSDASSRVIGTTQRGTFGSITLLGQRLDRRHILDSAKQQRGTEPLVGLDGTGDLPITSPYSVLLGAHPTGARAVLGTGRGAAGNATDPTTPRSILILERRFNSLMPTDGGASKSTGER
jgi:hypothetical protein